ncbi:RNA-binding protein 4F [Mortierella sp. AD032]|nr:RNA-binding protein 4F [Mortierella sp. AD032]
MADSNNDNKDIENLSGSEDNFDMDGIEDAQDGPSSETLEAIAALKATLAASPNQYEAHTQLIAMLKSADMFEELREAREAMNKIYPLSEDLWMDWINDEANMATSEDEKRHVLSLYERATTEYLSIKVWKSYVDYAVQEYNESKEYQEEGEIVVSAQDLTKIFKRADKWTGHHIPESHTIWNVWIDFELERLEEQDPVSPEDVKRVKKIYLDRIAIPHTTLDDTFSALSAFMTKYEPQEYEKSMASFSGIAAATRKLFSEREAFEQNLVATGGSAEAFTSYLNYEMRPERKHFARTRTLFERAIVVHCLVPTVWIDYVSFLMSMNYQKSGYDLDPKEVLIVAERSTRNCSWAGDLWESRFILMELYHKPDDEVNALFASALSDATLLASPQELSKVLQARCSYVVRIENKDEAGKTKIRAAFEHARDVIDSVGGDPYCKLEQLWIEIEAGPLANGDNARSLWTKIEGKLKASSESWLSRVAMEKRLGDPKLARRVFMQACNIAKQIDWPEKIFEAWLLFEREHGTVSEYKEALTRSRSAMKTVDLFRVEAALKNAYVDQSAYVMAAPVALVQETATAPMKKRKVSFQDDVESSKVAKVESKPKAKTEVDDDEGADPDADQTQHNQSRKPLDLSAGRHEDTCYVANFRDDMTPAKLKELFGEYGKVLRCTMAQPKQGRARFFAYIQFSTPEEAHAALALDGRDVGHRLGLQVKISDTNKATRAPPNAKPPMPKESRHELNVTGLNIDVKEEDLLKLVSLYAAPQNVFVKHQPDAKGGTWANVKFDSEADAEAAVAMNGLSFQGKTLEVTRRMFKNPEYEGMTRTEKRKLKAQKSAERRAQGSDGEEHQNPQQRKDVEMPSSVAGEAGEAREKATIKKPESAPAKPMTKLTAMAPRTMQPRSTMQGAKAIRGKPVRSAGTGTPLGAFKAASTNTSATVGSSRGGDASSTAAGTGSEGSGEAAAPAAPKSNAEFRALMFSGGLKKTRQ